MSVRFHRASSRRQGCAAGSLSWPYSCSAVYRLQVIIKYHQQLQCTQCTASCLQLHRYLAARSQLVQPLDANCSCCSPSAIQKMQMVSPLIAQCLFPDQSLNRNWCFSCKHSCCCWCLCSCDTLPTILPSLAFPYQLHCLCLTDFETTVAQTQCVEAQNAVAHAQEVANHAMATMNQMCSAPAMVPQFPTTVPTTVSLNAMLEVIVNEPDSSSPFGIGWGASDTINRRSGRVPP